VTAALPALRRLPARTLEDLASALRSGRIAEGAGAFQLQRSVPAAGEAATGELASLLGEGLSTTHAALLIDTLRGAVTEAGAPDWELVTSGPDAAAAARDTGVVVRELFRAAERRVLVVGYAVHQGRQVFAELARRMDGRPDLEVTLCLDISRAQGDTSIEAAVLRRFAERFFANEWPGHSRPTIHYDPRALSSAGAVRASLHAKCLVVDGEVAFLGSANFTEAAQQRNIECGLLVRNPAIATALEAHFSGLIQGQFLKQLPTAL